MSFTNNKMCIYELLGGCECFDFHPKEGLLAYDGGSCVILWDIVEDVKLRLHEHRNPVKLVTFFGQENRFILSIDSGPSSTIFISEWESLNRVAELDLPRKRGKKYRTLGMFMDYCDVNSKMFILENLENGYRIVLLSFKEFSVSFKIPFKNFFENF